MVMGVGLAAGLGALAALNESRWVDNTISVFSLAVVGLPEFVTGIILIEVLAFRFGLPANSSIRAGTSFLEALPSLILPALTATFVLLAFLARLTPPGVL